MLELRHRGGCPGPGGAGTPPPREGEAAGGDHETESTSDKVSECCGAGPRPWSGRVAGGPARPPLRGVRGRVCGSRTGLPSSFFPQLWGQDGTGSRRCAGCLVAATSLAFPP